jgi:hypothetical protein
MATLEKALRCDGGLITAYARHNPHYTSYLLIHGSEEKELKPFFVIIAKNNAPAANNDSFWVLQQIRLTDALKIDTDTLGQREWRRSGTKEDMFRIIDALGGGGLVKDLKPDELVHKTFYCRKYHLQNAIEDFRRVYHQCSHLTISLCEKLPVNDAIVRPSDHQCLMEHAGATGMRMKFELANVANFVAVGTPAFFETHPPYMSWVLLHDEMQDEITPNEIAAVKAAAKSRALRLEREKAVVILDRIFGGFVTTRSVDIRRRDMHMRDEPLSPIRRRAVNMLVGGLTHHSVMSSHKRTADWAATIDKKSKITFS